jgi:hypothetical protein
VTLWDERDKPVLRWLVENPPRANMLTTHKSGTARHEGVPSLTQAQVHASVEVLYDAGYVASDEPQGAGGGGVHWTHFQVTGAGKQALGLWPRFDALGSPGELADILEALARNAPTEEEASNLKRAAAAIRRATPLSSAVSPLPVSALALAPSSVSEGSYIKPLLPRVVHPVLYHIR